jgi:hypothetical protein
MWLWFFTLLNKDKVHQDMSISAVKLEVRYIMMNEDGEDTTKIKLDIEKFIKKWRDIGLPLKENGALQLHDMVDKNF